MTRKRRPKPASSTVPATLVLQIRATDLLQGVGCFLIAMNLGGRLLFPSEDAYRGTGLAFVLLGLLCGCLAVAIPLLVRLDGASEAPAERPAKENTPSDPPPKPVFCLGLLEYSWLGFLAFLWLSVGYHGFEFEGSVLAWEWTGIFGAWLFLRQVAGRRILGTLFVLVFAVAMAQSLVALWQVGVDFPSLREQLARRDPMMLRQLREMGITPGTVTEYQFQARLDANEAYGSFGHPNSLGGLLVLCLPPMVVAMMTARRQGSWVRIGLWAGATLLCLSGLLATKSSSALAAGIVAVGCLLFGLRFPHWLKSRKFLAFLLAAALLSIPLSGVLLWKVSGQPLDSLPAGLRSLRFRMEWWPGALSVIEENPVLGVGIGNFGSHYLKYKPAFSSEEIRDPHNFILELSACSGIGAVIAYLFIFFGTLTALAKYSQLPTGMSPVSPLPNMFPWLGGAIVGGLLATLTQSPGWTLIVGWIGCLALMWPARRLLQPATDRLAWGVFCGLLGIHLHFLVSGGIQYPALTLLVWSCAAGFVLPGHTQSKQASSSVTWLLMVTFLAATVTFLVTLYLPSSQREQIDAQVRNTKQWKSGGELLERYANILTKDAEGWAQLAGFHEEVVKTGQTSNVEYAYLTASKAWQKAIQLDPRRASFRRSLGKLQVRYWERVGGAKVIGQAAKTFAEASQNYPNSAHIQWEAGYVMLLEQAKGIDSESTRQMLAGGLWNLTAAFDGGPKGLAEMVAAMLGSPETVKSKASDRAMEHLSRSLELDQTPHLDKKLLDGQRLFAQLVLRNRGLDGPKLGAGGR